MEKSKHSLMRIIETLDLALRTHKRHEKHNYYSDIIELIKKYKSDSCFEIQVIDIYINSTPVDINAKLRGAWDIIKTSQPKLIQDYHDYFVTIYGQTTKKLSEDNPWGQR